MSTPPTPARGAEQLTVHLLNFRWLRMLRWAAVVGQTLAILVVHGVLGVSLPLPPMGGIVAGEVLLNLAAIRRGRVGSELTERELATWVGLDLIAFSALLYLSGGPSNPFVLFYMVHVAMAALTLGPRYAWTLVVLSVLSYGTLFLWNMPLGGLAQGAHSSDDLRLHGAWVAYALGASCIVYFMHRAREALREREQMLAEQRDLGVQAQRLSSLGTLAAGAAHELAGPLSTIAVVCKELEHELRATGSASTLQDVELMRTQVERCRKILSRMAHTAGEAPGEAEQWIALPTLVQNALSELPEQTRVEIQLPETLKSQELRCPREALGQTLRALLDNALDASETATLSGEIDGDQFVLSVLDHGPGMGQEVLERALEPFFTTKPVGRGMGLGLYLARNVATQLGGTLQIESQPQRGTRAELRLPKQRLRLATLGSDEGISGTAPSNDPPKAP